jgi:hypothetical protein
MKIDALASPGEPHLTATFPDRSVEIGNFETSFPLASTAPISDLSEQLYARRL